VQTIREHSEASATGQHSWFAMGRVIVFFDPRAQIGLQLVD
jgi:hypothetical protein